MDQLDRNLIRILQRDAKTPFTKIAKELKHPDTTIHFRARRLKENNIVSRYCALVRPEAFGFNTGTLLRIEIGGHIVAGVSKDRTRTFAQELAHEDHFLWIAVDEETMTIHAVMLGGDDTDLERKADQLKQSPDVINVTVIPIGSIVKGWELSGLPE
ncbi:MAG: Lrp/AsnC family transcriptional regulator [Candidatus Thorarchaeota archaeon]|nr:MAG: hypothetical protein DRP09_01450 [Candidatus Thorarchaeota archaeon]